MMKLLHRLHCIHCYGRNLPACMTSCMSHLLTAGAHATMHGPVCRSNHVQVTFGKEGVLAVAAVQATRHAAGAHAVAPKDLLLLHANGRLGLHIASRLVCYVSLNSPSASVSSPVEALLGRPSASAGDALSFAFVCGCQHGTLVQMLPAVLPDPADCTWLPDMTSKSPG